MSRFCICNIYCNSPTNKQNLQYRRASQAGKAGIAISAVCLSVCLSVSLSTQQLKNCSSVIDELHLNIPNGKPWK